MKPKDRISTHDLILMLEMLRWALEEVNARRRVMHELKIDLTEMSEVRAKIKDFLEADYNMDQSELERQMQSEAGSQAEITINLNQHLDPLAFLVTVEVARMVLGNKTRRDWVLDLIDLSDEDADEIYQRLSRLMAEVRATERKIQPAQTFPALESSIDENLK